MLFLYVYNNVDSSEKGKVRKANVLTQKAMGWGTYICFLCFGFFISDSRHACLILKMLHVLQY